MMYYIWVESIFNNGYYYDVGFITKKEAVKFLESIGAKHYIIPPYIEDNNYWYDKKWGLRYFIDYLDK